MLISTPADILVPAGRPGAQVQESDLLHAGFHRAAVFMCQPLLPRRQVRMTLKMRRKKGRAWPWQKDSVKDRNSLNSLEWRFSDQNTCSRTCVYGPIHIQLPRALNRSPMDRWDEWRPNQKSLWWRWQISVPGSLSCHVSLQSSNFKLVKTHPLIHTVFPVTCFSNWRLWWGGGLSAC